jgi:hypothetical protein
VLKDIISGSVEYFRKRGIDLIGDASFAPSTGITMLRGNYANMKGNGFDVVFNSKNIDKKFKWSTTLLFSHITDKVTHYDVKLPAYQLLSGDKGTWPLEGRPVYGVYSLRWAGLDPETGDPQGYLDHGVSKDYATLNFPDSITDLVYNGPVHPTCFGGLTNSFSYKHFSLIVNISYKLGYYFRRSSINYYALFNSNYGNKDFIERWQKPGDEKNTDVPSLPSTPDDARDNFYAHSEVLIEKGDHVRLQDIALSYDLDKRIWKKMSFSHVQFYLYANNIGIIWRANNFHLDPDYPTGGIPPSRSFAAGIRVNF